MNQKRSETLIKKVDTNTDALITRLTNMIALSASTSTQEVQASEMLQIEYNASMMVRLVEELLSVSRTLKENWILGQLPKASQEDLRDPTAGIQDKMNAVLQRILETKKFDEEVGESDEEEQEEEEEEQEEQEVKTEIKVDAPTDGIVDGLITDSVPGLDDKKLEVKEEPGLSATQTEEEEPKPNQEPEPQMPPIDENSMPDVIDIGDPNVLGDYDFDNFGNMGDQDNDVIMID